MKLLGAAWVAGSLFKIAVATTSNPGQVHLDSDPFPASEVKLDAQARETYNGHQVWRLDLSGQQHDVRRQVMEVLEVSKPA
jgi:hypothetical protein